MSDLRTLIQQAGLLPLQGAVQHYDWGGFDFIPSLLGIDNQQRRPFAELWIGAHPNGPTMARVGHQSSPLAQIIESEPQEILGEEVAALYDNKLPYLLKVLDARKMLSIQAHPTLEQAREGFGREESAGIPLSAPHRNYKDANHKPEVHVALTEFWMLHGFRPMEEISAVLDLVPEFRALATNSLSLRQIYQAIMTLPQDQVDSILQPLIDRLRIANALDKDTPDFWALRAAELFPLPGGHFDRGIFSIYLLNLLHLKPGQGTYQPAGMLHAYLEGVNVELMANSDNVLRGGLTPKHIDVSALTQVVDFSSGRPQVLNGEATSAVETVYRTPADEFELSRLNLSAGISYSSSAEHSADAIIAIEGTAALLVGDRTLPLNRGRIVLVPHGAPYAIESRGGAPLLFKASVPPAR